MEKYYWRVREWFPHLSGGVLSKLECFHSELCDFSQNLNLISHRTQLHADRIHFADSIIGSQIILNCTKVKKIYDVGSGSGFPGVIMALLAPDRKLILVEKDRKKAEFLRLCVSRMGLNNVEVKVSRIEELGGSSISCITSRALAPIHKMIPLLVKSSCQESYHFKSKNWVEEFKQVPNDYLPNWVVHPVGEYSLPGEKATFVIVSVNKK